MKKFIYIIFIFILNFNCFSDEMFGKIKNGKGKGEIYIKTINYDTDACIPDVYNIKQCRFYDGKVFVSRKCDGPFKTYQGYISVFALNGNFIKDIDCGWIERFAVIGNNVFVGTVKYEKGKSIYYIEKHSINLEKNLLSFGKNGFGKSIESFVDYFTVESYGNHLFVYGDDVREFDENGNLIKIYATDLWDKFGYCYRWKPENGKEYIYIYDEKQNLAKKIEILRDSEYGYFENVSLEKIEDKIYLKQISYKMGVIKYKSVDFSGNIREEKEEPYKQEKIKIKNCYDNSSPNYYLKIKDDFIEIWKKN